MILLKKNSQIKRPKPKIISLVKYSHSETNKFVSQKSKIDHHTMNAILKYQINNFNIKHHIQIKENIYEPRHVSTYNLNKFKMF
jgi:hypothetical protein